jgi:hypothetical protein
MSKHYNISVKTKIMKEYAIDENLQKSILLGSVSPYAFKNKNESK